MSAPAIARVPRARPVVQIGVGSTNEPAGGAQWQPVGGGITNSRWQTKGDPVTPKDTWVGQEPYWWDITCDVHDVSTFIGRDRANGMWEVGTATIVVRNANGWADYPPTDPQQTFLTVRPGRPIRVGMSLDGGPPTLLWGGYIDVHAPGYDASEGEIVTFDCIDAKGEAGRAYMELLTAPVGANETAPQRLNRILNMIVWPSWRRDLAPAAQQLLATSFDMAAVDAMNLAADSSLGFVYGDVQGRVAFRGRDWSAFTPTDPIQGVIGNFGTGIMAAGNPVNLTEDPAGSGLYYDPSGRFHEEPDGSSLYATTLASIEDDDQPGLFTFTDATIGPIVCPQAWELSFSREDISTKVVVGRFTDTNVDPPIAPVVREDAKARAAFGSEVFRSTELATVLTFDLGHIADRVLAVRSPDYMPRVAAVTLDAATALDVADVLVAADPYRPARFICRHQAEDGRTVFTRTMIVTGVEHSITPDDWTTRIALDESAPFTVGDAGRWSDGVANTARWNNRTTPNALASAWSRNV